MWWKFFMRLVFGLFLGSVAVASLFLTVHEQHNLRLVARDYSSHIFSNLTAEEINRRTLKAAAVIKTSAMLPLRVQNSADQRTAPCSPRGFSCMKNP